jgi:hypothetical protein
MNMRKIFDIGFVPANMGAFFKQFVLEFEKSLLGGGQGSVTMFSEDGPREGFSTTFKSVGNVYNMMFVKVQFAINGGRVDVLMGFDLQTSGPMAGMIKGMMNWSKDIYEAGIAQFVEAAIKRALRETQES